MLASVSGVDRRADTPLVDWSDLAVSGLLPTGTVTLLLADVEGSTRLWEDQPDEMTAAVARLNQTVSGVRVAGTDVDRYLRLSGRAESCEQVSASVANESLVPHQNNWAFIAASCNGCAANMQVKRLAMLVERSLR